MNMWVGPGEIRGLLLKIRANLFVLSLRLESWLGRLS